MTEKQLQELGLTEEQVSKVMELKGKAIASFEADKTALATERDTLKTQLTDASAQIKAFEGMDIEGVKKAASDWEVKAKKAEADAAAEIASVKFQYALDQELVKAKAKDPVLVRALLKLDALKHTDDGIIGLKEQIEPLTTSHGYLFDTGEQPPAPIAPMNPVPGSAATPTPAATPGERISNKTNLFFRKDDN